MTVRRGSRSAKGWLIAVAGGRSKRSGRQLELGLLRGRGGPGRGQGRIKRRHDYVPHRQRPFIDRHHPVHVSTRVRPGLPSLRGRRLWLAVRRALVRCCDRERFRIVHFSVQGQHVHLLCEAADARALSRGIQGFKISLGRRVNATLGRKGAVFRDRYHERVIATPTQARHALAYVLNNARHHAHGERATYPRGQVDPCSSAPWFDGFTVARPRCWGEPAPEPGRAAAPARGAPVARARWWLLREGWRRGGGRISPDHVPGLPRDAPALPTW